MRPIEKVDFMCGWGSIAQELGISVRTAQRWHEKSPLPISYVGGTPTTTRAKLQAWANDPSPDNQTGRRDV